MRRTALALLLPLLLAGCGGAEDERIPAITDDMGCAEVAEVVAAALDRGRRFIAGEESDALLADELVFALSGADARPECVDEDVRSRAAGMRATLRSSGT